MTVVEPASPMSVTPAVIRRDAPRVRRGFTTEVSIAGTEYQVLISAGDDHRPANVYIEHAKHGSFGNGMLQVVGALLTESLHHGLPLERVVALLLHTRFEPHGLTDDPDIRWVTSPIDYVARLLALHYLPRQRCIELGVLPTR
ncbi:vitamin B12-dependent ribonucleotide reductase [Saccharopolyspora griseoalba]|uniref:ribonucleoside-diphosphate reductase n=1 Tax=Saccharopolyspora griseoalba TaxID=1431848 RepID=A0ABW2LTL4_9PSEU